MADLLRCLAGNLFSLVPCDPAWRTSVVVGMADGIRADRAFDRLPILADALEEAGCDDARVLAHCRDDAHHARGCWVVDLILRRHAQRPASDQASIAFPVLYPPSQPVEIWLEPRTPQAESAAPWWNRIPGIRRLWGGRR
jgi:hypothetical protein